MEQDMIIHFIIDKAIHASSRTEKAENSLYTSFSPHLKSRDYNFSAQSYNDTLVKDPSLPGLCLKKGVKSIY